MVRTAVQLHTLRNLEEEIDALIEWVATTPFEGVQPRAGLTPEDVPRINRALEATGLELAGAHVKFDRLVDAYDELLAIHRDIGNTDLVIGSYDAEAFVEEAGNAEAARRISELATRLADDGMQLHYHNHYFEFAPLGDGTAYDAFVDRTDDALGLEIDTGLAQFGDADPVPLFEHYGDRVSLVHVTDTIPGSNDTVHHDLGKGIVDLPACFDAALAADVDWLIFEHGRTDDPKASIRDAGAFMTGLLADR